MRAVAIFIMLLAFGLGACRTNRPSEAQPMAAGMQLSAGAGAGGAAGAAGSASVSCQEGSEVLGIASAQLTAPPPLKLTAGAQLLGDGLPMTLMTQQNVTAGLRWQNDRMFMLADPGFWDIPVSGTARWYPTSAQILWGVRSGDLDGDGDEDLLLLSMSVDPAAASGGASPFQSRLSAWERTPSGLVERAEVLHSASMSLPMPYVLADVDGDSDLDIVTFERGAVLGYVNAGAFTFTRKVLGDAGPEYMDTGAFLLDYADRDQDGSPDLLLILGNLTASQLENSLIVMSGDRSGAFGAPGPAAKGKAPLVQHGPDGIGIGIADVTGDGLADVIMQDPQGTDDAPIMRLHASTSATSLAPAVELEGLGFEFADVDADGHTDIVTTRKHRLVALLARPASAFEARDLGVSVAAPQVLDFVVEPGKGRAAPVIHMLYKVTTCPACGPACSGRCLFGSCAGCLSDADCKAGRCDGQTCAP